MRKNLWWKLVLVAFAAILVLQWSRAEQDQSRLKAAVERLLADAAEVRVVRDRRTDVNMEIDKMNAAIAAVRRLLPETPQVEKFMGELKTALHAVGIEVEAYAARPRARDLYQETLLEISVRGKSWEEERLKETLRGLHRIVQWNGSDGENPRVIRVTIFNAPPGSAGREVRPCPEPGPNPVRYFPFNALVTRQQKELVRLCAERKGIEGTLQVLERYRHRRADLERLLKIAKHLETTDGQSGK